MRYAQYFQQRFILKSSELMWQSQRWIGMTVSQVAYEVLYTGLIEMQELNAQRLVQLHLDYFKRPPHSQS